MTIALIVFAILLWVGLLYSLFRLPQDVGSTTNWMAHRD